MGSGNGKGAIVANKTVGGSGWYVYDGSRLSLNEVLRSAQSSADRSGVPQVVHMHAAGALCYGAIDVQYARSMECKLVRVHEGSPHYRPGLTLG